LGGSGTTLGRVAPDGSGETQTFVIGAKSPIGVAVDSRYVYWANNGTSSIGRANLDGTDVRPTFIPNAGDPYGVAVDSGHIYWASVTTNVISRANLDGTGVELPFISNAKDPEGVAVDGSHIYWANAFGQTVGRANLDGTDVKQDFIPNLTGGAPDGVAVNGQYIYWTDSAQDRINRVNIDGTNRQEPFISGATGASGVAVDDQYIYWGNAQSNRIGRANLDGTAVRQDFAHAIEPDGLAADQPVRATTATSLACAPSALSPASTTNCTATVSDTSATPSAPAGAVAFTATGSGSFAPAAGCTLAGASSTGSTCQVTFRPGAVGHVTLTASYAGDSSHSASSGGTSLTVTPAGSGGGGGGGKAPIVRHVRQSARRWLAGNHLASISAKRKLPVGTTFSFVLNESARVTLTFTQAVTGRRVHGRCVARNARGAKRRRCSLAVVRGTLTVTGHAGANSVHFEGRLAGRRRLGPGSYTVAIIAANPAGQRSATQRLSFTIVRRG
jgi:virginiamycin B lyase